MGANSVSGGFQGRAEKSDLTFPLSGNLGVVEGHAAVEDDEAGIAVLEGVIIVAEISPVFLQGSEGWRIPHVPISGRQRPASDGWLRRLLFRKAPVLPQSRWFWERGECSTHSAEASPGFAPHPCR